MIRDVQPQDLIKYGLIPEFVGRIPITVGLHPLDESALVNILTAPKNALVKQYIKLLEMDGVTLEFEDGALTAIADKAIERKTGARGLRSIMEEIMSEVMYAAPSETNLKKCIITEECVRNNSKPKLLTKARARLSEKSVS
jgi:ATP-dependent Clp protease ATP-binding subunit ClpX